MAQLEERKAKLEQYWAEYNDVHLELRLEVHLESLDESESCDRDGFEEVFYALSGRIRELISSSMSERPSFLRPPQVFTNQIVVRSFGCLS